MNRRLLVLALPLGAAGLAGCDGHAVVPEETVLAEAATLENPRAGLYEQTTEILAAEVPGAPPDQADRLRDDLTGVDKKTAQRCVTEAEAKGGFEKLVRDLTELDSVMKCDFTRFDADAPRVRTRLACSGAENSKAGIDIAGTTTAEGYDITMDLDTSGPKIAGGSMALKMRVTSKRLGDCPPPEAMEPDAGAK